MSEDLRHRSPAARRFLGEPQSWLIRRGTILLILLVIGLLTLLGLLIRARGGLAAL